MFVPSLWPLVARRPVNCRNVAAHRPQIRRQLPAMMNRIKENHPQKFAHRLFGNHLPAVNKTAPCDPTPHRPSLLPDPSARRTRPRTGRSSCPAAGAGSDRHSVRPSFTASRQARSSEVSVHTSCSAEGDRSCGLYCILSSGSARSTFRKTGCSMRRRCR